MLPFSRSFDVKNVGQIKQVYPAAFHYKQEKNIPGHYDREMFEQYQLTVASNVEETGTGMCVHACGCDVLIACMWMCLYLLLVCGCAYTCII